MHHLRRFLFPGTSKIFNKSHPSGDLLVTCQASNATGHQKAYKSLLVNMFNS
jgi:hypothetical protein